MSIEYSAWSQGSESFAFCHNDEDDEDDKDYDTLQPYKIFKLT